MDKRAFTLMEIIVVGLILGILTAVAIPSFAAMTNRGYQKDAATKLMALYAGQQTYKMYHGSYLQSGNDLNVCYDQIDPEKGIADCVNNYGGHSAIVAMSKKLA